jgi:predicted SprT family Zn-dependent metalloprotease
MRDKEIVGLYQAYLDVYSNSNEEVEQLDEDVQGCSGKGCQHYEDQSCSQSSWLYYCSCQKNPNSKKKKKLKMKFLM